MSPASGVVAVVPVFRPGRSLTRNITVLAEQVAHVVVVDDGSGPVADEVLGELAARGVEVLRLESNAGIARALNAGVERALGDPSVDFVLTLDQDSTLCPGFVDAALRTFAQNGAQGRVGVVSPSRVSGGAVRTGGTSGTETMPRSRCRAGW